MASKGISQTAKVYHGMYKHIVELLKNQEYGECDRLASTLLTKADLPIIIRARCRMILDPAATACAQDTREQSKHGNFIGHADAAVHVLEKARQQGRVVKDEQIEQAKTVQHWTNQSYQELVDAGVCKGSDGGDLEVGAEEENDRNGVTEEVQSVPSSREAIRARVAIVEEAVAGSVVEEETATST
ncbi:hypothetical protein PRZ48_010434 [Zasmidium cellare]|uniref:Uncharacterized protein n=1 Tax=Zasmidium cellare TaxID=395010 RepID=A0ABR0E971_ZASCE|nr:hypothetical protein PRZ48_010434 [Zasmidium cellare]